MSDRTSNLELLRRSPFFASAGEVAMAPLLQPSFIQQLPRGTLLFDQHELPNFLHLLLTGSVGLRARDGTGAETVVEIFRAGELFLVPPALLGLPYLVSGLALTDVRVLMIPSDVFRHGLAHDAALARATTELLARHWRLMVDQVVDLKLRPAERRLARFLARRIPEEASAGQVDLPEARIALARRLGMTPETLSRALATLEQKGAIRQSGRHIIVIDRAAL